MAGAVRGGRYGCRAGAGRVRGGCRAGAGRVQGGCACLDGIAHRHGLRAAVDEVLDLLLEA